MMKKSIGSNALKNHCSLDFCIDEAERKCAEIQVALIFDNLIAIMILNDNNYFSNDKEILWH